MSIPPILCVAGASGSGKTTLLERLIAALSADGVKVGAVKHASSALGIGPAGKDSTRLAAAGARPAVAAGPGALIVQHGPPGTRLVDLAAGFCADCDLVLAEGYKHSAHDKILVLSEEDSAGGKARSAPPSVRLVVGEGPDRPAGAPDRNDIEAIAAWVKAWLERRRRLGRGVVGAILVGGSSRRMGADKAALRLGDRPVTAYLAELLAGRLAEVWVVGGPVRDVELPNCISWHLDLRGGCGPLGGIATALRVAAAQEPRAVLAVACDMPLLGPEAVELLLEQRRPDTPASALRNPRTGRLEPLAAIYEPAALAEIERALEAAALSATKLLESVGAHQIEVPPEIAEQLLNVNTPEELAALRARIHHSNSH